LPDPAKFVNRLQGTTYSRELIAIAEDVLRRNFQLLGYSIQTESEIRWRRDYVHGRESGLEYFRRIPYLDFRRVGDHKVIWELNRHQHLVVLAQAFSLSGQTKFLDDLWTQLGSWIAANPLCRGINWTSALEVAFRSLSWLWIDHLAGSRMPERLRSAWLRALHGHGRYLENNLSVYFSPNTHLQGEAVALHALGVSFGDDPRAVRWRSRGAEILEEIIQTHVRPDGVHFEQSSYYHVYATDLFLFHAALRYPPEPYLERLRKMAGYLWAISSSGELPLLGDDDGGRLFYPYGSRRDFSRATLASCAVFLKDTPWHGEHADLEEQSFWLFGPREPAHSASLSASALFSSSGIAILAQNDIQMVVDNQAFGFGGAGHSHAHALHFTLRRGNTDVLIDPGTYTYVTDPILRDRYRSTAAHNTVRVDRRDQADAAGPFRWNNLARTEVVNWSADPWRLHAVCNYRRIRHHRQIHWEKGVLFVLDRFEGQGVHLLEQFWHPGGPVRLVNPRLLELPAGAFLSFAEGVTLHLEEGGDYGWYSDAPGRQTSRPLIRIELQTAFPAMLATAVQFSDDPSPLRITHGPDGPTLQCGERKTTMSY
jgi:hypothetical protein